MIRWRIRRHFSTTVICRRIRRHFSTTVKMQKKFLAANDCRMIFFVKLESRKIRRRICRRIAPFNGSSSDGLSFDGSSDSLNSTDCLSTDCLSTDCLSTDCLSTDCLSTDCGGTSWLPFYNIDGRNLHQSDLDKRNPSFNLVENVKWKKIKKIKWKLRVDVIITIFGFPKCVPKFRQFFRKKF
jgi:hypothetical protein